MSHARRVLAAACLAALCACGRESGERGEPGEHAAAGKVPASPSAQGVMLTAAEQTNLGLVLIPAPAASYRAEAAGFGRVIEREVVAQALTDLVTARAAARQSAAALERIQRLAGTPGADSAAAREAAERQNTADAAAVELATAKAASSVGQDAPWLQHGTPESFQDLGAGRLKLIKASFPLGALRSGTPARLRFSRLDEVSPDDRWRVPQVWPAPADPTLPGRSYFALIEGSDLTEGERLLAWAAADGAGPSHAGAFVPASALVQSDSKYWCYTRRADGGFVRTPLDTSRPLPGGYFVTNVQPGTAVVTAGAGLLLAHETGAAADD